jgi:putative tricarboxylic transport membrane protein
LRKTGHDLAPMILGFVLGPLLETNLRRSLIASDGDWSFLLTRPVGLACLLLALGLIVASALPTIRQRRLALAAPE